MVEYIVKMEKPYDIGKALYYLNVPFVEIRRTGSPWHTETPEKDVDNLILHIMSDEDDIEGYYQSGYYEHGRWIKWNGCGIALDCGEYVDKWAYEKEWKD